MDQTLEKRRRKWRSGYSNGKGVPWSNLKPIMLLLFQASWGRMAARRKTCGHSMDGRRK